MKDKFDDAKCIACKGSLMRYFGSYCFICIRARDAQRTKQYIKERPLVSLAGKKVKEAIKKGVLKGLIGQKCKDCGKDAQCYDHRNYHKPLDVEAVCFSCNKKRGPGTPYKRLGKISHSLPRKFGIQSLKLGITRQRVYQMLK